MSASSDPALLGRLVEFQLALERDSSEHVEEFDWGRLIHNPKTDAMWSGNYVELQATDFDADRASELADQVLGPLGLEHRFVVPADPAHADRLVPGFQGLDGWEVRRSVFMVRAREPDREAGPAKEVTREEVKAVRRVVAEDNRNFTKAAVEQRSDRDARLDSVGSGRWFAAPVDGPPGASCVLYEGDGIADEWPWKLYERLGFDRVGEVCDFLLKPPQLRGDSSP